MITNIKEDKQTKLSDAITKKNRKQNVSNNKKFLFYKPFKKKIYLII